MLAVPELAGWGSPSQSACVSLARSSSALSGELHIGLAVSSEYI